MEWITEHWYIFLLGLIAAMYLFGNRTKESKEGNVHVQTPQGTRADAKKHESGHGCC